MQGEPGISEILWGYLCVVDHGEQGLFGGYLLVNSHARPVEFHCTTPIRPSRAQEILYGSTLQSFLYGEQIGKTLIESGGRRPRLLLVDEPPTASVSQFVDLPVALIHSTDKPIVHPPASPCQQEWQLGDYCARLVGNVLADASGTRAALASFAAGFDLTEPFARIRLAIDEARRYPAAA